MDSYLRTLDQVSMAAKDVPAVRPEERIGQLKACSRCALTDRVLDQFIDQQQGK